MSRAVTRVAFGFIAVLIFIYVQLFFSRSLQEGDASAAPPQYHVKIISNDTDTVFHSQFVQGARDAGEDYDLFVELEGIERWDENALPDAIQVAIFTGVDAVAFQSNDPGMTLEMYELALENHVEIMLYESENYQNVSILAAGSNSYSIGTEAGALALEAAGDGCRAVLVIDRTEADVPSAYQNMKIQGVMEVFSDSEAEIVETFSIGSGVMGGEALANTLLEVQDDYNTIICLHEKTTPLIAQRLIDSGLVDSVHLIGYGARAQTLDYISREVIYGTICPDAYEVGYNTVALMYARLNQEQVNDYSSTRLFTITRSNVDQFNDMANGGSEG